MGWALWAAASQALDVSAWQALWADPQTLRAWGMTLWTGLASTVLVWWTVARLLAHGFIRQQLARWLTHVPALLATPHAALAIGLVLWLSPSGWALRLESPGLSGLDAPPPWLTTQDPWGLGLVAVLVCKEIPFLLWAALSQLQRPDVARRLQQELALARTLGYPARTAWWRVAWPQLQSRLHAPLLAVLAYGLTVVDMALVIGPTSPPTLAVLTWQWLQDADPERNAQGAAAAWALAAVLAGCATGAWWLSRASFWRRRLSIGTTDVGQMAIARQGWHGWSGAWATLLMVYGAVMLALLLGSAIGSWPFPQLLPPSFSGAAWQSVAARYDTLLITLTLGLASSTCALLWTVAWLELAPARWQRRANPLLLLPLVLPGVLWVLGLHQLSLAWRIDAQFIGLWLAHTLACLPYVLLALQGPYTAFDPRLARVSATLGQGRAAFLWRVKWPLLRAALAASFAVGLAVSVAQYLPTLYVGAGRFSTISTEAVALASGGQRSLAAAYAWAQWLLPVLGFAAAAWLGRARRLGATPAATVTH